MPEYTWAVHKNTLDTNYLKNSLSFHESLSMPRSTTPQSGKRSCVLLYQWWKSLIYKKKTCLSAGAWRVLPRCCSSPPPPSPPPPPPPHPSLSTAETEDPQLPSPSPPSSNPSSFPLNVGHPRSFHGPLLNPSQSHKHSSAPSPAVFLTPSLSPYRHDGHVDAKQIFPPCQYR